MSRRSWIARSAGATAGSVVISVMALSSLLMSWHRNRPPDDLAALQAPVAVERLIQVPALHPGVDRAGAGQRDDLGELADGPPAGEVDRALERHVARPHRQRAAAAPDVDDVAARPHDARREAQ